MFLEHNFGNVLEIRKCSVSEYIFRFLEFFSESAPM